MTSRVFIHAAGPCTFCRGKKPRFLALAGTENVICEECVKLCEERFLEARNGSDELRREMAAVSEKERALYEEHVKARVTVPNEITCSFCESVPGLRIHILAGPEHYICKACVDKAASALPS